MFARRATAILAIVAASGWALAADPLPRFTEEREAAALHFVRKHCPELVPLLDEFKKTTALLTSSNSARRFKSLSFSPTFRTTRSGTISNSRFGRRKTRR